MKLFLISQSENHWYDMFDSAVVCADDEDEARAMSPMDGKPYDFPGDKLGSYWCSSIDKVSVRYIGEAAPEVERGVVCASFNAG